MEQLSFASSSLAGHSALYNTPATHRESSTPIPGANVTEIILPETQVRNFHLLLPMLTQLNQEDRWLAWIDPPAGLFSHWQQLHGSVAGQILVLRSSAQFSALTLAEMALSAGTCHAVVLWTDRLSRPAFRRLEQASAQGRSHGVVMRHR